MLPYLDAAYRFARWLTRSSTDADDLVQEAFLRAFRGFDGLRGGDAKAWLLTIVRNCHASALRQQQRRATVPLPDEQEGATRSDAAPTVPEPESASLAAESRHELARLLATLP